MESNTEQYAQWLVDNQDKKGSPEFETVSDAYKESKQIDDGIERVLMFARSQKGMPVDNALATSFNPTSTMNVPERIVSAVGHGVAELGRGVGQIAGVVDEADIEEARRLDAPLLKTGSGTAGSIMGTMAAFLPTSFIPGANTYTGSAAIGAVMGASQPTLEDESRLDNALAGALGGAAGRAVTGVASRATNPHTRTDVTELLEEGVTPTPGQIVGGTTRKLEESLRSLPFLGDGIKAAESQANQQFNTAAINRVLAPLGRKIHGAGQEAIESAGRIISKSYDDILDSMNPIVPDEQFSTSLASVRSMIDKLPEDKVNQFGRILKSEVTDKLNGSLPPASFKAIQSELGRISRSYRRSPDFDQRELGSAVLELRKVLTDLAARQNPVQSAALKQADEAYAGLLRIEDAAARNPTTDGIFSPAQLGMSARKLDPTLRNRATARGRAPMQSFAQTGREVLGENLPDSGTANRLASMLMVGSGYAIDPALAATMVGGRAMYTPMAQKALAAALAKRPEVSREIGRSIEHAIPISAIVGGTATVNQ